MSAYKDLMELQNSAEQAQQVVESWEQKIHNFLLPIVELYHPYQKGSLRHCRFDLYQDDVLYIRATTWEPSWTDEIDAIQLPISWIDNDNPVTFIQQKLADAKQCKIESDRAWMIKEIERLQKKLEKSADNN